jgi:hypothetical protein
MKIYSYNMSQRVVSHVKQVHKYPCHRQIRLSHLHTPSVLTASEYLRSRHVRRLKLRDCRTSPGALVAPTYVYRDRSSYPSDSSSCVI